MRGPWRGRVRLAHLIAFAGGCVLATVAGARRTGSAYQRFLLASKASDVLVSPAGTGLDGYYQAPARLASGPPGGPAPRAARGGPPPGGGASWRRLRAASRSRRRSPPRRSITAGGTSSTSL